MHLSIHQYSNYLQAPKIKEAAKLIMLTLLPSHDKTTISIFVAQLIYQVMYHYSGSVTLSFMKEEQSNC